MQRTACIFALALIATGCSGNPSARNYVEFKRPDGSKIKCPEPPPAVITKSRSMQVEAAIPKIDKVLSAGGSTETMVQRIREEAPDLYTLEVLNHLLCTAYGNGIPNSYGTFQDIYPMLVQKVALPADSVPAGAVITTPMDRRKVVLSQSQPDLDIPGSVEYLYVFLQTPGPTETARSERLAAAIPKEEFIARFGEFRQIARNRNMRLIVTATDEKHNGWYQPQIRFQGKNLRVVMYKSPDENRIFPGAEVPLS